MERVSMRLRVSAAAALALVALAGCGDEDRPPAQPTPAAEWADPRGEQEGRAGGLAVEADPGGAPVFRPESLRTEAGRVALQLVNPSTTAHSLCVEAAEQAALGCTGTFRGDRGTLRLRLEAGRYTFFCNVAGHRAAGMRGTLVVE
jgi:plastocyanin